MPSPAPPRLVATRPAQGSVRADAATVLVGRDEEDGISGARSEGSGWSMNRSTLCAWMGSTLDRRSVRGMMWISVLAPALARLSEREVRGALVAGDRLEAEHGGVVTVAVDTPGYPHPGPM
eukprot:scaffold29349_cov107-Isochrysis_galbana.AAC.1